MFFLKAFDDIGSSSVKPHNGIVQRFTSAFVPCHSGLSLVSDTNCFHIRGAVLVHEIASVSIDDFIVAFFY